MHLKPVCAWQSFATGIRWPSWAPAPPPVAVAALLARRAIETEGALDRARFAPACGEGFAPPVRCLVFARVARSPKVTFCSIIQLTSVVGCGGSRELQMKPKTARRSFVGADNPCASLEVRGEALFTFVVGCGGSRELQI